MPMMRILSLVLVLSAVCSLDAIAQSKSEDERQVVGIAQFSCKEQSPYTSLVTEKVVEMLTNSKRFCVVDRTSRDKIEEELELQKSEAFLYSGNVVEQDMAVGAEKIVTGEIIKIPIYRMKNGNGTVRGYKASVAFQMKVVDVATGVSTEATSFEGKASKECLSPESAVTMAMTSLQGELAEYFRLNFPIRARLVKIEKENKGVAEAILIKAGKTQGIKVGDKFNVETVEIFERERIPVDLGTVTVTELRGDSHAVCKVNKKDGTAINDKFNEGNKIFCTLIIKK